jgi:two-component system, chemotaxis family, sensor kinase CheA
MNNDLARFKETFFEEAAEHVASLEAGLIDLEGSPGDRDLLDAIFRAVHSIKGGAGMFAFDDLVRFAHALESLLDQMREGQRPVTREVTDMLLRSSDILKLLVASARSGAGCPGETGAVLEGLDRILSGQAPPAPAAAPQPAAVAGPGETYRIRFEPGPGTFRTGMDPLLVVRDVAGLGELTRLELDAGHLPPLDEMDPETCYLAWNAELRTTARPEEIRDLFAFVEDEAVIAIEKAGAEPAAKPGPGAGSPPQADPRPAASSRAPLALDSATVRVATAKVDKLVDLVGELVIAQSMAGQILSGFSEDRLAELREAFSAIERNTRELQERVMAIRMLPIGGVFSRFSRLVRDLAAAAGKKIALEVAGEETELDKSVIERLADPLTHLVRNAVDHGIEKVEGRRAAGKPEQGVIRLEAYHEGGNVVVEVTDDGRGLDPEKIRRKALERGLIEESATLGAEEVQALIFQPGFSTAETVTDLSGRGVGMDVVRRNVEALNGSVGVRSQPGRGASFRIRLPLTLAILDGLLLKVGAESYVLPLVSISESIRPRREEIKTLAGSGEVVLVRGEPRPLLRLHAVFGVDDAVTDPCAGAVVMLEYESRKLALLVDELLGQQQVVVKSLETHYRKVDGVMGATILGDGRAALILDVAGIAQMAGGKPGMPAAPPVRQSDSGQGGVVQSRPTGESE